MSDREILEAFNEKAKILQEFRRLIEAMHNMKVGVRNSNESNQAEAILEGPDKESIHASILNIRFFMQDNEKISIRNLSQIYKNFSTSKRNEFEKIRQNLNTFLDAPSPLSKSILPNVSTTQIYNDINEDIFALIKLIKTSEVTFYTNREIFEAFIYGDLSHMTKRAEYKKLLESHGHFSIFVFWDILRDFIQHVFDIQALNSEVLRELSEHG